MKDEDVARPRPEFDPAVPVVARPDGVAPIAAEPGSVEPLEVALVEGEPNCAVAVAMLEFDTVEESVSTVKVVVCRLGDAVVFIDVEDNVDEWAGMVWSSVELQKNKNCWNCGRVVVELRTTFADATQD